MSSMQSVIFVFARVDLIEISSDTNHIIYGLSLCFFSESSNVNHSTDSSWFSAISLTHRGCFGIWQNIFDVKNRNVLI